MKVPSLGKVDQAQLLESFLQRLHRQLTPEQASYLHNNFLYCPTPLYLRVACDIACKWHSFTEINYCCLEPNMEGIINLFFDMMEKKHGRN